MTPHWTEQRDALREWLVSHPQILIGCDFDGTLAPLVPHADEVSLPETTRDALTRLSALPGVQLAFISGRGLADLRRRVALPNVLYAGNHGLEMTAPDGSVVFAPAAVEARSMLQQVQAKLAPALQHLPGVWIEDKQLTLSIHFRQAAASCHAEVEQRVRDHVRGISTLEVRPAKCIWEIRPAIDWDKGSVLRCFLEQTRVPSHAAAFMGDDVTDQDAFRELPDGWTFFVGDTFQSTARLRLHDPRDTAELLCWMAEQRTAS